MKNCQKNYEIVPFRDFASDVIAVSDTMLHADQVLSDYYGEIFIGFDGFVAVVKDRHIVTYGIEDNGFAVLNEMPFQSILSIEVEKEVNNGNAVTKLCVKFFEGGTDKEDGSDVLTFISLGEDDSEYMTYRFIDCYNNWNEMMDIGQFFDVIGTFYSDIAEQNCEGGVSA